MPSNTFLHIKGISYKKELELWRNGIKPWGALEYILIPRVSILGNQYGELEKLPILSQSRQALQ